MTVEMEIRIAREDAYKEGLAEGEAKIKQLESENNRLKEELAQLKASIAAK